MRHYPHCDECEHCLVENTCATYDPSRDFYSIFGPRDQYNVARTKYCAEVCKGNECFECINYCVDFEAQFVDDCLQRCNEKHPHCFENIETRQEYLELDTYDGGGLRELA